MNQSKDLRVADVVGEMWRSRWSIIAFVFFATIVVIVVSLLMRPVYRADVLLAPQSSSDSLGGLAGLSSQFGGLAALAGLDISGGGRSSNESIAVLRSREFTQAFIEEHALMPVLFEEKWDSSKEKWNVAGDEVPTIEDAYLKVDDEIRRIDLNLKTGLIRVSVDWYDRELAAKWANAMIRDLNNHVREKDIDIAEKSIEYLKSEFQEHSEIGMQQGILALVQSQVEKIMLAKVQEEYAFRVLDPAVVADLDNRVRPKRTLMVIVGFGLSILLAMLFVLIRMSWNRWLID